MKPAECEGDNDKRTVPVAPDKLWRATVETPDTPWQALMECRPGDEPVISKQELLPLREVLADAIDNLTERERWIVERWVIERQSFAQIGRMLGLSKSMAHKVFHHAARKLRAELRDHPLVVGHLRTDTDD